MRRGLKILADAARMTLRPALLLRCWGLPSLILIALLLASSILNEPRTASLIPASLSSVVRILATILPLFLVSWGAVGWHRTHLAAMQPRCIPAFPPRAVVSYAMITLVIVLAVQLASVVSALIVTILTYDLNSARITVVRNILSRIIELVFLVLTLRASLILPAIALDKTFREWIGPKTVDWLAIMVAATGFWATQFALEVVSVLLFQALWPNRPVVALFVALVINLCAIILCLSVVTALYGHLTNRLPRLPNPPLRANPGT